MPSTAIEDFDYDEDRRQLFVRFRNGRAYTYHDVPPDEYLALQAAPSKGTFVNTVIKAR